MFKFFSRLPAISTKDLAEKLSEKPLILDVRSPQEFKSGHIPGAKNIPLNKVNKYKPKRNCYVVCASGMRSRRAAKQLKANGYDVVNVKGGMNK